MSERCYTDAERLAFERECVQSIDYRASGWIVTSNNYFCTPHRGATIDAALDTAMRAVGWGEESLEATHT